MLHGPKNRKATTRTTHNYAVPDEILREKKTDGRARVWYLVKWLGYEPEWEEWRISGELGEPVTTWEPRINMLGTEALETWEFWKLGGS